MTAPDVRDVVRTVTLHRRKGDALARGGHHEEAKQAYEGGLQVVDETLERVAPLRPGREADIAELLGSRGGLLRRLGLADEALKSYRAGAQAEVAGGLSLTYNRTNAIKLALIAGHGTVAQLQPDLVDVREALEERLSVDERAVDDAWLWADLGDVRLLMGDLDGAKTAYMSFAARAKTESPSATLSVLQEVVNALEKNKDQDAARVSSSLDKIRRVLVPPRAFVSFDFDNNEMEKNLFVGQARSDTPTPFTVHDWSSKIALFQPESEKKIKQKMAGTNMCIVLVGRSMSTATGVAKEIVMAKELDVPVFGVYVDGAGISSTLPPGLERNRTVVWSWLTIAAAVEQMMGEGKNAK